MRSVTFHLTSPPMRGCQKLQAAVNHHLRAWGVPDYALLKVDGVYGANTRRRTLEVAFGLGIEGLVRHGVTYYARQRIYNTRLLNHTEAARMHGRAGWRRRLARRLHGHGPDAGRAFANAMMRKGIVEHPAGSNSGPYISDWEHLAGYPSGIPWCGCFVNACLVAAGLPSQMWGIGYVPFIEAHAKAGIGGWRWEYPSATPKRGWIATFGRSIGEHTEYVTEDGWPLHTVGGNTSKGDGSFNEGGGVYGHNFAVYQGYPLRGFAVPPYH